MDSKWILIIIRVFTIVCTKIPNERDGHSNITLITQGLIEITKALPTNTLILFEPPVSRKSPKILSRNRFLLDAHKADLQTCTFTDVNAYFQYLQDCEMRFEETTTLILANPAEMFAEVWWNCVQ